MKLKFYDNPKLSKDEITIGKHGDLRFKKAAVQQFGLQKGQRWLVAIDKDEKTPEHIYLIKTKENDQQGFKLSYGNSTFHIRIIGVLREIDRQPPMRCKYESFEYQGYKGIKVKLPEPIKQK